LPYLPVDLDAKRKAHGIERALGLPRHTVAGGLTDLWEVVWREKSDTVDELMLDEAFGPDPRIRSALVARDFLEPAEERWRVRGAAKWLFGLEGRSRGGKASKGNLVPGPKPKGSAEESRRPETAPSASAEDQPKTPLGSPSALSPSTQHPAPRSLSLNLPANADALPPEPVRAGKAKADKPTNPRHAPMVKRLVATFLEIRGVAYAFGPRDAKEVSTLLGLGDDDEIDRRWRRGLLGQFKQQCDSLADLVSRWNALTRSQDSPGRAGNSRFVAAQDVDKSSLAKTGTSDDF
jgi:hypothetical protein